jgi:hypothetical protein
MELSEGETRSCKKSVSDAKYDWFLENRQCRRDLEAQREQTVGAYQKLKRQYREHGEALQRWRVSGNSPAAAAAAGSARRRAPAAGQGQSPDRFVLRQVGHDSILGSATGRPRFLDEGWAAWCSCLPRAVSVPRLSGRHWHRRVAACQAGGMAVALGAYFQPMAGRPAGADVFPG